MFYIDEKRWNEIKKSFQYKVSQLEQPLRFCTGGTSYCINYHNKQNIDFGHLSGFADPGDIASNGGWWGL